MSTATGTDPGTASRPPPKAPPVLETVDLGIRFGGLQAVRDVSFSVPEGETLGVIGPNGAGKSTLINLVTGHLKPSYGQVLIDGVDMTGKRPWAIAKARVARTFQIVKPFRGMTVRENVAVGVMYGGGTRRRARALEEATGILEELGLTSAAERAPGELSVADARRLEFARALAIKPRLLLLDEVMAGLRPNEIEPSIDLIHRLKQRGLTILVVEHVMKAILAVSDRILVMNHGEVLVAGDPSEIMRDPRVIEAYLGNKYADRQEKARQAALALDGASVEEIVAAGHGQEERRA